ncbi:MAG: ThuA domain-containing protein [Saprospiraceae bacterium]|nr:ThuA domain-containing protein [Saprospiraceae bacterium]
MKSSNAKPKFMHFIATYFCLLPLLLLVNCKQDPDMEPDPEVIPNILVFSKTAGFRHASIPEGVKMFKEMAADSSMTIVHSEDAAIFNHHSLSDFDIVVFLSTTGTILNADQKNTFQQYIEAGGKFLGIHSATDTEYDWPWFGEMIGARFNGHPHIQEARLETTNNQHPAIMGMPAEWNHTDEYYNFRDLQADNTTLVLVDESTYEGGTNGDFHPISWCKPVKEGKMFYTALGHTDECFSDTLFRQHIKTAIAWLLSK